MVRIALYALVLMMVLPRWSTGQMLPKQENGKWGVVDTKGEWLALPTFQSAYTHSPYLIALVDGDNRVQFAHGDGRLTPPYDWSAHWYGRSDREGIFRFKRVANRPELQVFENARLKTGNLCFDGHELLIIHRLIPVYPYPYRYENTDYFFMPNGSPVDKLADKTNANLSLLPINDSLYYLRVGNEFGVVKNDGSFQIEPQYQQLYYIPTKSSSSRVEVYSQVLRKSKFVDACALFPFQKGELWGYMDENGTEIITPRFTAAYHFNNGRAAACENGRFGYIDTLGTWIIPPRFRIAFDFNGEVAPYPIEGQYGFIDRMGKEIISAQYERIVAYKWHFIATKKDSSRSFISCDGVPLPILMDTAPGFITRDSSLLIDYGDSIRVLPKGLFSKSHTITHLQKTTDNPSLCLQKKGPLQGIYDRHQARWLLNGPYQNISVLPNDLDVLEESWYDMSRPIYHFGQHWIYQNAYPYQNYEYYLLAKLGSNYYLHATAIGDSMAIPKWLAQTVSKASWVSGCNERLLVSKGADWIDFNIAFKTYRFHKDLNQKYPYCNETITYQKDSLWGIYSMKKGQVLSRSYSRIHLCENAFGVLHFARIKGKNGHWAIYDIQRRKFLTAFEFDEIEYYSIDGWFKTSSNGETRWINPTDLY